VSPLWYVGQGGIVIELVGAGLGVYYAWQTREAWRKAPAAATYGTIMADDVARPRQEFIGQYRKQMAVFALIGLGLALQFIGNFSNR
jgi:hypothetical protein